MNRTTSSIALAIAVTVSATILLTGCGKTEQAAPPTTTNIPSKPADDLGSKSKDDLARIRELMEKDEARRKEQEAESRRLSKEAAAGARKPLLTFGRD